MTRPASHRDIIPDKSCGNCRFSACVRHHGHLLCFHGDDAQIQRDGDACWDNCDVELREPNGQVTAVELLVSGDGYHRVWVGRSVEACLEVCDEWQPREVRS